MLDPRDINTKQFATTRIKEGYDQTEVDEFLDRVEVDYRALQMELVRVKQENEVLRRRPIEGPTVTLEAIQDPPSVVAEKLIRAAGEVAQQHEADAKAEADRVVREAGAKGAAIVEEALAAAEKIKQEGMAEKYRRIEELDTRKNQVASAVNELESRGRDLRLSLSEAIAQFDRGIQ